MPHAAPGLSTNEHVRMLVCHLGDLVRVSARDPLTRGSCDGHGVRWQRGPSSRRCSPRPGSVSSSLRDTTQMLDVALQRGYQGGQSAPGFSNSGSNAAKIPDFWHPKNTAGTSQPLEWRYGHCCFGIILALSRVPATKPSRSYNGSPQRRHSPNKTSSRRSRRVWGNCVGKELLKPSLRDTKQAHEAVSLVQRGYLRRLG